MNRNFEPVWTINSNEMGLVLIGTLLIMAFPILPILDIPTYLVKTELQDFPLIVKIAAYAFFIWFYIYVVVRLEMKLLSKFFYDFVRKHYTKIVYIQTIPLAFLISSFRSESFEAHFSFVITLLLELLFKWLFT
ncbi:hypothetical protein Q6A83_08075 [Aliarcobacter skirrowii]|uniref:hypothetical protein n=1 Tax=Aliarcobacter skirrowii TaxID=28200 RepID=UPI0029A9B432|nr:hypothetical protein [Aliarcobacter skirrowii]MDX4050726.1 hypothetical protein [Aliarcobacter skirrowii]